MCYSSLFLKALEGFSNVPLLHPLETLHNNLNFHQVDDFLGRVCATKFPVPDMHALASLASKNNMDLAVNTAKVSEFPSSSNSSGGPNSPTALSTPADLLKTLGMYIGMAKGTTEAEPVTKDLTIPLETKENTEIDLSNLAMTGSYTITMDFNTSSSTGGQGQGKDKDQIQVQDEAQNQGQGKGQAPEEVPGQVQFGAQDSLEECMAQMHHAPVK
ncbi:inositol hexakisphosphate and diphosphoinositol-pentakisphosphate kinase 1 [Plakobranchus ocellatus]|uniref:Inositol hexakisphosphate and diphosphoinositol-pentakisphosphate kinase 1 n=1 Tax=Plakobranchus ocellatus TaxID=259542 RepID=A0AAV4C5Y4_9GAST|nr:inositol hexakisphosphate and diphosphoinositol-pentakisphosphate kinase 1 [Plakobranchus ocellatus]